MSVCGNLVEVVVVRPTPLKDRTKNSLPEEIILAELTDDGQCLSSAGEYLAVKLEETQESFLGQRVAGIRRGES